MTERDTKVTKKVFIESKLTLLEGLTLDEAAKRLIELAEAEGIDFQITGAALRSHMERIGAEFVWLVKGTIQVAHDAFQQVLYTERGLQLYQNRAEFTRPAETTAGQNRRTRGQTGTHTSELGTIKHSSPKSRD